MAKKFDGVIEAVRYKNGQIEVVRAFERRGAAFTDRIMLNRKEFLERIKKDHGKFRQLVRPASFEGHWQPAKQK